MRLLYTLVMVCGIPLFGVAIALAGEQAKSYRYRVTNGNWQTFSEWDSPEAAGREVGRLLRDGHVKVEVDREVVDPPKGEDKGCDCNCCRRRPRTVDRDRPRAHNPMFPYFSDAEWEEHQDDPTYFGLIGGG